jgi:hypothetical protein
VKVYLACFVLHFALLLAVSLRDTFSFLAGAGTLSPPRLAGSWERAETIASDALGAGLAPANPLRQAITVYTNAAGIEAGYAFFAPNVPNSYKLVFELHYGDGHVEYELPHVADAATGLRLNNLFENIAAARFDDLRELLLKMLAYSVWQKHSDVIVIRAVFGSVISPSVADFEAGKKESYEVYSAYDFTFPARNDAPKVP